MSPSGSPPVESGVKCHACTRTATRLFRIVPYTASLTLWDTTARDIRSCPEHVKAARGIGTVIAETPLGDGVAIRLTDDD